MTTTTPCRPCKGLGYAPRTKGSGVAICVDCMETQIVTAPRDPTDGLGWYVVTGEPGALSLDRDYRYNLKDAAKGRAVETIKRQHMCRVFYYVMFYDGKAWDRSTLERVIL